MKTLSALSLLFFAVIQAQAVVKRPAIVPRFAGAEIGEWTMDHDTALAKAKEGTNNVVVMFNGAWWCPHCQALESTVLTQPAWQAYAVSNRLYLVMMDNPGRADQYWCWLRETNYVESVGLTLAQGEVLITNRYDIQTAYALPGAPTNTVKGASYLRVGYPTLIALRPDGSRLGRFTPLLTTVSMDMVLRNMNQLLAADAGDEKDDYYQGATLLEQPPCEEAEASAGTHTLGEADATDWYAFDATPGVQWSFALRAAGIGIAADVRAQIFDYPTNSVSLADRVMTPSDLSVLTFVVPKTGRYWLKISRVQTLTELLGYDLAYWYGTPPATVLFASPQVSVSDRALFVTLTVNITGATTDAEVRVSYETVAGSAQPGQDYVETVGELVWGAGIKKPKTFTLPLLSDSVWEGDETFNVVLYAMKNCEGGNPLSTCTVVMKEQTARQPGKLGFEGALAVVLPEGSNALFRVARTAGDNGAVTAKVEQVQGKLRSPVSQMVWTNGESAVKSFAFSFTNEAGFQPDRVSSLVLTPSGGAALFSAAAGTMALTRQDDLVIQTFAAFSAEPVGQPFGYTKTRGLWFYGFFSDEERLDGWLRSGPVTANDYATLTSKLTGAGLLAFDWRLAGGGATLQCLLGGKVVDTLTHAESVYDMTLTIPPGRQSVAWTVKGGVRATGVSAAVRNLSWYPLPQASGPVPADKAAVINRDARLSWTEVLGPAGFPVGTTSHYEFYAGVSSAVLAKYTEQPEPVFPRPGNEADGDVFSNLVAKANSRPLYWRVDTVVQDAVGRRAVTLGKTWSVTVLPEGSPEFVATPDGYDPTVPGGLSLPEMTVGVYCEAGPIDVAFADGGSVQASARNGTLPGGMRTDTRDGAVWIVGVPVRVGTGSSDLYLTVSRNVGGRNVTVAGSSVTAAWTVRSLGRAAGQFNGYSVKDGLPAYGSAALTVADAGNVSGKFVHEGLTYTFWAAAFGGYTNAGYFAKAVALSGTNRVPVTARVWADGSAAEVWLDGVEDRYYWCPRNNWRDAAMAALLNTYAGYYTLALPVVTASSENAPRGAGYLAVTVRSNGSVTYAGLLADGKSVSGSTTLLYGPDCCSANDRATFYLFAQPSGYGRQGVLCGHVYLDAGADLGSPKDNTLTLADEQGIHWINPDPKAVYGYNPATGVLPDGISGFTNDLDVTGGYYDKTVDLRAFYAGKTVGIGSEFLSTDDFDGEQGQSGYRLSTVPDPLRLPAIPTSVSTLSFPKSVQVMNGFLVDLAYSTNAWSMTVLPNRATGIFSGSFKFFYQGLDNRGILRQKTKLIMLRGVFLPVRVAGQPYFDWMGCYQIPDKCRYLGPTGIQTSYPFNWSVGFWMGPE